MFKKLMPLLLIAVIMCLSVSVFAQQAYIWLPAGGSGDYQVAANWSPTRTTPATNDILIFDGSQVGMSICTATNVNTETIGALTVINNCQAYLSVSAAKTLTCSASTTIGPALFVGAGSQVIYYGGFALTIALPTGSRGTCNGDIIFTSTGNTIPNRLTAVDSSSLVFASGATFQFAPGGSGAGNAFGTGSNAPVTFYSGATYFQGGFKTSVQSILGQNTSGPSAGTGSSVMGAAAPNQTVWFMPGSVHYNWTSVYSWAGRVFGGDYIDDNRGAATAITGANAGSAIWGTFRVKSSAAGQVINNVGSNVQIGNIIVESGGAMFSSNTTLTIYGNLSAAGPVAIASGVTFSTTGASALVSYNANQNVTMALESTVFPITVNNPNGITLLSTVTTSALTMTSGNINTGANSLVLGTGVGATGTYSHTAGTIIGNFQRWIAASALPYVFPVGTASNYNEATVDFTPGAPSVGGTLSAIFTAGSAPAQSGLPLTDSGIDSEVVGSTFAEGYWTISAANGLTGGTYNITLEAPQFNLTGGAVGDFRVIKRATSGPGAWVFDGTSESNSGHVIVRNGLTTGFSDFAVAGPTVEVPVELSNFDANGN